MEEAGRQRQADPMAASTTTTTTTAAAAKTPKTQENTRPRKPPKTWRERIFHSLPYYTGPYSVGYMELELPAEQPRTFSNIKRESGHAQLDTVLFGIYYPTNADPRDRASTRVPWLPRPRVLTCRGYSKFFNLPHQPVTAYMASTCMFTKLPAIRNTRVAQARPSSQGEETGPPGVDPRKPKFPVVVFSHGLGGSRTMYSTVCGDLASYGFVVVAMEHRDGSGARSYVNVPPDRESPGLRQRRRSSAGEAEPKRPAAGIDGADARPKRARSYMVDYLFPKDNAQDTAPNNAKGVDRELRGAQIEMRIAEIEEAYKVLQVINEGDPDDKIKNHNLRKKPNRGSSSKGLEGIHWADWTDRLSLDDVTAMGHSFGGATTVQILRRDDRFPWIAQGILLDAWGPATPEAAPGSKQTITKPLLSIGSEAFMHWTANYDKITQICAEAQKGGGLCWMLTVKGSTHLSQTDFALLYPRWMSLFIKTLVNPLRAIYLTVAPVLEFLKIVLPPARTAAYDTSGWVDEGLLRDAQAVDEVPAEHKPDQKWIAARLRVRHEFKLRLQRLWKTVRWAAAKGDAPEDVPRDEDGRPLFGLETWGPGEEVWVHMCPNRAHVEGRLGPEPEGADGVRSPRIMRMPTSDG